jgi:hypothetical protein
VDWGHPAVSVLRLAELAARQAQPQAALRALQVAPRAVQPAVYDQHTTAPPFAAAAY